MTEKEFRKLVTDLEILSIEKNSLLEKIDKLENILKNNKSNYYEIVEVKKIGSFAKGTLLNDAEEIDVMVVVKTNNDKAFLLNNYFILNDIENVIISNYQDIIKLSNVLRNTTKNIISFTNNNFTINIYVCYEEEYFVKSNMDKHIEFVEIANRDYTYFRNALKIIKYFRDENNIQISGHILEIMLYYALNEYFIDNRYETYLNAFVKTIDEFAKGNKIQASKDIYQKLNVNEESNVKKQYMVLDVANPNINLTDYVTDVSIGEFRKLKKAIQKTIGTKQTLESSATVVLDINPILNNETSDYKWSYKIDGTTFNNNGGSYSNTTDGILTAMYKGLYKGLRAVVDNNLNRKNIEVHSSKGNILKLDASNSEENRSRIRNIESYMENNNITLSFK